MGELSDNEEAWLAKATAAAVAGARKIALGSGRLMNAPVGQLAEYEWGMIVAGAIFGWIEMRVQEAIAEGRDSEQTVRLTGLQPDPYDSAVVRSILPRLADQAGIDWSQPLAEWPGDVMTGFLLLAWRLIREAETARDHGQGKILKKAEYDWKTGDPIPFWLARCSSC